METNRFLPADKRPVGRPPKLPPESPQVEPDLTDEQITQLIRQKLIERTRAGDLRGINMLSIFVFNRDLTRPDENEPNPDRPQVAGLKVSWGNEPHQTELI